jgi:hypothetical protein
MNNIVLYRMRALLVSINYFPIVRLFSEWEFFIGWSNPLMWVRKIGEWMKMLSGSVGRIA